MQLAQSNVFFAARAREFAATAPGDGPWRLLCALAVIPFAAVLHHAAFYHEQCMLNPFGDDYSLALLGRMLLEDPSLLVAGALALIVYGVGLRAPALRGLLPPFLIAFTPLVIWVWDIPGTERFVCDNFHDLKVELWAGVPLKARYFYLLGAALFAVLLLRRSDPASRRDPVIAPRPEPARV